jgi:hypothetical protein
MATAKQERLAAIPSPNDKMTVEDAQHAIDILQKLLDTHGCPLTREYIRDASLAADMAHNMAHTIVNEQVADSLTQFLQGAVADADKVTATGGEVRTTFRSIDRDVPTASAAENAMTAQQLFDNYNKQYFDGRLAYVVERDFATDCDGYCCSGRKIIYLSPSLSGYNRRYVLLHEMAHAVTGDRHTDAWLAEMERLESLGALTIEDMERVVVLDEQCSTEMWREKVRRLNLKSPEQVEALTDENLAHDIPNCCDICRDDFYREVGVL